MNGDASYEDGQATNIQTYGQMPDQMDASQSQPLDDQADTSGQPIEGSMQQDIDGQEKPLAEPE